MYGVRWSLGPLPILVDSRIQEGTPFAAQTTARNTIRTVVDQGLQRAEVMVSEET